MSAMKDKVSALVADEVTDAIVDRVADAVAEALVNVTHKVDARLSTPKTIAPAVRDSVVRDSAVMPSKYEDWIWDFD